MKDTAATERIYRNQGNQPLLRLVDSPVRNVLDVGCGAGDNARNIKSGHPGVVVHGLTRSAAEATVARANLDRVTVCDLELGLPEEATRSRYDLVLFSHVLEHLTDPARLVAEAEKVLEPHGAILIAVPNVVGWRQRWEFVSGRFDYRESGVMDSTHLRFFTYHNVETLLSQSAALRVVAKAADGGIPLWLLRRHVLPETWAAAIDRWSVRNWPNLFGDQVLLKLKPGADR